MRVFKRLSYLIVGMTLLCLFGYKVKTAVQSGGLGRSNQLVMDFVSLPDLAKKALQQIVVPHPTYTRELDFEPINDLAYDVYGLNSFITAEEDAWEIRLFNFKDDSVVHTWRVERSRFEPGDRQFQNCEPRNPILLPDRSLLVSCDESRNLFRLDADSKVIWHNKERRFHHAMNLDAEGDLWTCTRRWRSFTSPPGGHLLEYHDHYITKIDVETGEVLYDKSLSEMLVENQYHSLVFGNGNGVLRDGRGDPLHLNDVEPALSDGRFWKKGDLFISLRHRSLVMQYRPATEKIVRLIFGPFLNQHDVDFISDEEISIFNNNEISTGRHRVEPERAAEETTSFPQQHLNVITYKFADSSFESHFDDICASEKMFTPTQGFHHRLKNGDYYVEAYEKGIMYFLNESGVLYKKQFDSEVDGWVERPHWVRIYEDIDF